MKSFRWIVAKLVIFTVVTIAITVWLAAVIGNVRLGSSPYAVTAEFSDATGLLGGDVVKAAGVTVGRVGAIEISNGMALVTLSIDESVQIPADVSARIRFRNLVGQRMVTLVEMDTDSSDELLADGDTIPIDRTEAAFDLTVLFNGLRPLIRSTNPADVNIVTEEVTRALRGRGAEVEALLGNLASFSNVLASKDTEIKRLLDSVNIVAADLGGRDEQLRRTLANINSFLTDIALGKADLEAAIIELDDAATRFGRIIERNDANITAEIDDLATILDAVEDEKLALQQALRRLPGMLVAVERATTYGQWTNIHLIHVCKDDTSRCGRRWAQ